MKHLLNNLSEEEKNSIREQHTDKIKIDTSKFKSLMESKLGDVKPLVEQNRRLFARRFIRITNSKGKTLLFDVTEVATNSEGCTFTGDFRGGYDSLANFLGFDNVLQLIGFGYPKEGKAYSFNYNCSDNGKIVLAKTEEMSYNSKGELLDNGVTETFTIDTAAQEVLSKVCKCSRYK